MRHEVLCAETAVLACLAGTPRDQVAQEHDLAPGELRELIRRYTAAGRAALRHPPSPWHQFNVEFNDASHSESTATAYLFPVLCRAQTDKDATWWFLRKPPGWRLRILPAASPTVDPVEELRTALQTAQAAGLVQRWWCSPYEPETMAFGGECGMALAHELHAADSGGIARLLTQMPFGDEEPRRLLLSLLLMTHLHRAAGLDLNERGDVWARVAAQRPAPHLPAATAGALAAKARVVLTTDTTTLTPADGLLHRVADWATDIEEIGTRLGAAARSGSLRRGLREVLALHVIFHWNRIGLGADQQAVWANAATDALLGDR